jgi:hypothetical protein
MKVLARLFILAVTARHFRTELFDRMQILNAESFAKIKLVVIIKSGGVYLIIQTPFTIFVYANSFNYQRTIS